MKATGILFALGMSAAFYAVAYFVTSVLVADGMSLWLAMVYGVGSGMALMALVIMFGAWAMVGTPERQAQSFRRYAERNSRNNLRD